MTGVEGNLQMKCVRYRFDALLAICCSACLVLTAGCGPDGPEIARVEGTVRLDNKPLAGAIVVFVPPAGRPSAANTDENGYYLLEFSGGRKGAVPGLNRVEINTYMPGYIDEAGQSIPTVKELVPSKYNKYTTLEFDVQPGERNVADFDLDSKGKIAVDDNSY